MNNNLLANSAFISAMLAFLIAQFLKPFVNVLFERRFVWHLLFSTGGMPSSHTAGVVALVTSIGLTYGVGTVYFAISATFASITIHDAMGIRRAAGKQAEVINEWSRILSDIHNEGQFTPENLKTMLGHSFSQILGGTILGLVIGLLVTNY
ncbi:MAG: Divergent PAP2 family protein [Spirochaetes bacterium ADurb.Bin315]|nr:divergent PAP2 family protein [Spirochaetales bacterium]OQA42056.1 MAG: Divergent PAP2 family protein [Spirochaetes bacterium ADurb.Bin315]HOE89592.1 divergent PAP2 family protein [Sphaerochaeta sp.]HOR80407.1 divergent PAP2 family protein [Sphaerochaeta sp.]HPK64035.1 divergent PAP2 family protein [Sphaerochaeta sp.]